MQITLLIKNYIEGIVDYIEFISNIDADSNEYLDELYQKKHKMGLINEAIYEKFPNFQKKFEWCINCGGGFFSKSSLYNLVYDLILIDFPNCKKYLKYEQNFNLSLSAIPDYLDGDEASKYIEDNIFSKIPLDLSRSKQIKFIKEQCKKDFFIEGNKIPHWVQSCEWPIRNNKPCKYLGNKRKGDLVEFLFEDIDTHNTFVVKQYY